MEKIRAIKNYTDLKLNKRIKIGEEYEVTEERAKQILAKGYAELIEKDNDLGSLKKQELLKLAKDRNLEINDKMTKQDLLELLNG